ncbi:MAG: proline dehydrogenase family protein [Methanobacteriota archaeon]
MGLLIRVARQWIAGERREDALRVAEAANAKGVHAIVNLLGEHHRERAAVEATLQEYLDLLDAMKHAGIRGGVSVKPTQLGVMIDRAYSLSLLSRVLDASDASGRGMWLDMESVSTTDDILWLYERLLERDPRVGVCLQANLRRTRNDLEHLLDLGGRIRLTKGAYRESADAAFQERAEVDREFLRLLDTLFRRGRHFAVASHDGRMIDRAIELSRDHDAPFEFQMLQGVRDTLKAQLVGRGFRVAEYIPYGPGWLPYFSRRLRERPRNVFTMVRSFVSG